GRFHPPINGQFRPPCGISAFRKIRFSLPCRSSRTVSLLIAWCAFRPELENLKQYLKSSAAHLTWPSAIPVGTPKCCESPAIPLPSIRIPTWKSLRANASGRSIGRRIKTKVDRCTAEFSGRTPHSSQIIVLDSFAVEDL